MPEQKKLSIDVQGHRGCRGLYPENTLPAFLHALDLGVTTLELDLAVSKDLQLIVSHEPFFHHEISTHPHPDTTITEANQESFNVFEMEYATISTFDVGTKGHAGFPEQNRIVVAKPLFSEMIAESERHAQDMNRALPYYNAEIKSKPEWDSIFYPSVEKFCDLAVKVLREKKITERTTLQSFDPRALRYIHKEYPKIRTVLLIGKRGNIEDHLEELGYQPEVYSPYYALIDDATVEYCQNNGLKLIPWTVNEREDMIIMLEYGVDGIITDYPNRLIDMLTD